MSLQASNGNLHDATTADGRDRTKRLRQITVLYQLHDATKAMAMTVWGRECNDATKVEVQARVELYEQKGASETPESVQHCKTVTVLKMSWDGITGSA